MTMTEINSTSASVTILEVKKSTSLATPTVLQVGKWIWNTIFHQILAVVAIYAIWVPIQRYSNPFSWHVILSTLGIVPLMAESFILFFNDNVWSQKLPRKTKYWIHGILISVASFLVVLGVVLEINRKEVAQAQYPDIVHFESAHAITGLISMIFIILALACGPLAFNSATFAKYIPPVWSKFIHNVLGQFGYIVGVVSLIFGYYTRWFIKNTTTESVTLITIATVVVTLWSLVSAGKSTFNQIKSIIH